MVELHILGPTELAGGRNPSALLRHPRDLAVLAYVAATGAPGGTCSRDRAATAFWPDSSEKRARNALNQALHRIRRATSDDVILTQGQALRLNRERIDTDVRRYWVCLESGDPEGALALYRGALMHGFHIRSPGRFEQWLDQERARLEASGRDAARGLRDSATAARDLNSALRWARRAIEISDKEEEDVRALIRLLAQSGDRVAAMREYEKLERWMETELELTPSPETRAVVASLTASGPRVRPVRPAASDVSPGLGDGPVRETGAPSTWVRSRSRRAGLLAGIGGASVIAVGAALVTWGSGSSAERLDLGPEALSFYRQAEEYVAAGNRGEREENWRLALEMSEQAVKLAPTSAAAHAGLGMAHLRWFHWGFDRSTERQGLARAAIDRSIGLDPNHPEATRALAWYYQWAERDYGRALEAGSRTLEALPDDTDALTLVFAANRRLGRAEEALPIAERLVGQAGSAASRLEWATTLIGMRDYARALEVLEAGLRLFPAHGGMHYERWLTIMLSTGDVAAGWEALREARIRLGANALWPVEFGLYWLGRDYRGALRVLEREQAETFHIQQGDFPVGLMSGLVHRLAGEAEQARTDYLGAIPALEAKTLERPDEPWFHAWLAVALAGAGNRADALAHARVTTDLLALEPDAWENPHLEQEVLVHAYIMAGEHERAIEILEGLLGSRYYKAISREWIDMDPRFDPLRSHPGWAQISPRVGLPR